MLIFFIIASLVAIYLVLDYYFMKDFYSDADAELDEIFREYHREKAEKKERERLRNNADLAKAIAAELAKELRANTTQDFDELDHSPEGHK